MLEERRKLREIKTKELAKKHLEARVEDFRFILAQLDEEKEEIITIDGYKYKDFWDWIKSYTLSYESELGCRAKGLLLLVKGMLQDSFLFFNYGDIWYWYRDWFDDEFGSGFDSTYIELKDKDYKIMKRVRDLLG